MPKILLEDSWQFTPDRSKITESSVGGLKALRIPGTLSMCDEVNGNNRRYRRPVWENNLREGSHLKNLIAKRAAFGLLEHPKDGNVDLNSPISHLVTDARLESNGTVVGEITILEGLPEGHKLMVLINAGYNPLVSSRGYGSVVKAHDGVDEVQDDFVCEGWDVVARPSFVKAQLMPQRESLPATPPVPQSVVGAVTPIAEQKAGATPAKHSDNTMELKDIRQMLESMKAVDPNKLSPTQLAEGFARMTEMHRQVSALGADHRVAWDCTQLHESIKEIEQTWSQSVSAPRAQAITLSEDKKKLVAVCEALVGTSGALRKQLTETAKKHATAQKLYMEVAQRGRSWKAIAVKRSELLAEAHHKINVACAALDMLVEQVKTGKVEGKLGEMIAVMGEALDKQMLQYHTDTAALARENVELKFGSKLSEDQKKALAEAKTLEDVLKIKKDLTEGTSAPAAAPAAPAAAAAPAPVAEGLKGQEQPAPAPVTEGITVERTGLGDGTPSIEESIAIAKRLTVNKARA